MSKRNSRDLINPFKKGEEIIIPAGSKYSSSENLRDGYRVSSREQTIVVFSADGGAHDHLVHIPEIGHLTTEGHYHYFVLSKAILTANGRKIAYREPRTR